MNEIVKVKQGSRLVSSFVKVMQLNHTFTGPLASLNGWQRSRIC
jgi:hypothetical protein